MVEGERFSKTNLRQASYDIKNKEELEKLLERNADGIELDTLRDCYVQVEDDIRSLTESKIFFQIENRDTKKFIVYTNFPRFAHLRVDGEFKTIWKEIDVKDEIDLEKNMNDAGLKMMEQAKRLKPPSSLKQKQREKKVKLTNTHLDKSKINLEQDYIPKEK